MNYLNPVARLGYARSRSVTLRRRSAETKNRCGKMPTLGRGLDTFGTRCGTRPLSFRINICFWHEADQPSSALDVRF